MKWLLIIVGMVNGQPQTMWTDHATIEVCKAAGVAIEREAQSKGIVITGMSCIGHNADNTVDFHFNTDGHWSNY
jgi:hypothetical protein